MLSRFLWRGTLVLLLLLAWFPSVPVSAQGQGEDPILQLIQRMPTRMKVGQLALVSFPGAGLADEDESEIAQLIKEYGIGGVWLRPENGNFGDGGIAATDFISMTNRLQTLAWEASQTSEEASAPYLPLFVAVEPGVSGLPITSFVYEASSLPAPLALGATWDRPLVEAAGEVMGRELSDLGVNLFLGPDLDVLYTPRPGDPADLGGQVFGGDPYWVGELGRAYTQGLHQGSEGALIVAPRHFPGLGSTDRPLHEEVPTVQKSLEQLKQIELAPFFSVTAGSPGVEDDVADALLVTHIRYRGFQGNIRLSTRPISLDAQALQLALEDFRPWRDTGGLVIADNLGLESIRRFDDPTETSFNSRRIVRDALLAGNDLLIMDRFALNDVWADHFANIRDALDFLAQRYENDAAFRARMDEALYRIISLKARLYPGFSLPGVLRAGETVPEGMGTGDSVTAQVAMRALTRLAPFSDDSLPAPPQLGENIVIFTQVQSSQSVGEGGAPIAALPPDLVEETLLRLSGPEGTGQVRTGSVRQFTFQDLLVALANPEPDTEDPAYDTLTALQRANWIIFATTGLDAQDANAAALKAFLNQQAGLLDGRIVVFNFGPPYMLDSTEISKLDLYYALYSLGEAFVQAGIQALFQDLPVMGTSPVSIPALNYDLAFQTMPDPDQTISLGIVDENGDEVPVEALADIYKDDVVYLQTGVIVDRNGHPVPDGTPVQFTLSYPQEDRVETIWDETAEGVALTSVVLDRVGQLDITVQSEPALPLFHLQLTIREDESVLLFAFTPTPEPTEMPPTPTLAPDVELYAPVLPDPLRLPLPHRGYLVGWGLFGGLCVAAFGFVWMREHEAELAKALQVGLEGLLGGLGGYVLVIAGGRWASPAWIYRLSSREFLMGGVALLSGALIVWLVIRSQEQDQAVDDSPDRGSATQVPGKAWRNFPKV